MIQIIDYGMGNLRSVQKALQHVGAEAEVVRNPAELNESHKLILPGVGAVRDAMAHLNDAGWTEPIVNHVRSGRPLLGICLGMQLLFDASDEGGDVPCLGLLKGRVVRFNVSDPAIKVPHMGWNGLSVARPDCPLLNGLEDGCEVYFVHSYFAMPTDQNIIVATTDHGGEFCAVVQQDNLLATQFHPEKSQANGLKMLENFAKL